LDVLLNIALDKQFLSKFEEMHFLFLQEKDKTNKMKNKSKYLKTKAPELDHRDFIRLFINTKLSYLKDQLELLNESRMIVPGQDDKSIANTLRNS
jgi:hypothetical protein